jgi:hypothetical protein
VDDGNVFRLVARFRRKQDHFVATQSRGRSRPAALALWAALPLAVTLAGAWASGRWWLLVLGLALTATVVAVGRENHRQQ